MKVFISFLVYSYSNTANMKNVIIKFIAKKWMKNLYYKKDNVKNEKS